MSAKTADQLAADLRRRSDLCREAGLRTMGPVWDALPPAVRNALDSIAPELDAAADAVALVGTLRQERDDALAALHPHSVAVVLKAARAEAAEAALATARQALTQIAEHAEAWHGPEGLDSGHARALGVIGTKARRALAATDGETTT